MKTFLSLVALSLAGCAAPMVPVGTVSNFDLCIMTMRGGNDAMTAQEEAARRGVDCTAYYPAIQAQQARQDAAAQQFFNSLRRPPPPPRVNCTSDRYGNRTHTTCR